MAKAMRSRKKTRDRREERDKDKKKAPARKFESSADEDSYEVDEEDLVDDDDAPTPPPPPPPPRKSKPPAPKKSYHDLIADDVVAVLERWVKRNAAGEKLTLDRGAKLLNNSYTPDLVVRRGLLIDAIYEIEDKSSWKSMLGVCIAADYICGIEDARRAVPLQFVVPDDCSESHLKLYEMRLAWARPYCRRIQIRKVMRVSTFVAYWNQVPGTSGAEVDSEVGSEDMD